MCHQNIPPPLQTLMSYFLRGIPKLALGHHKKTTLDQQKKTSPQEKLLKKNFNLKKKSLYEIY